MEYIETIRALIRALLDSRTFHALVIESTPGWGKSTTVEGTLRDLGLSFLSLGAYSTPLSLFHALSANPASIHLIDDCAGLFDDPRAMAVLKAASWATEMGVDRRVVWSSTSERVGIPEIVFRGKLVLLTNAIPTGKECQAFLSRCLSFRIRMSEDQIRRLLLAAARDGRFGNPEKATQVAEFLISTEFGARVELLNLRTLRMACDFAASQPESWRAILRQIVPRHMPEREVLREIASSAKPVKEQVEEYRERTGLSRRTYFNRKRELGGRAAAGA